MFVWDNYQAGGVTLILVLKTKQQRTCLGVCVTTGATSTLEGGAQSRRGSTVSPDLTKLRLVKASQTASCVSQLLKIHFTLFCHTCRYKRPQPEWATFNPLHTEISQPPKPFWGSFHQRHMCSLAEQHLSSDREIPAIQEHSAWLPNTPVLLSLKEHTERTISERTVLGMRFRLPSSIVLSPR